MASYTGSSRPPKRYPEDSNANREPRKAARRDDAPRSEQDRHERRSNRYTERSDRTRQVSRGGDTRELNARRYADPDQLAPEEGEISAAPSASKDSSRGANDAAEDFDYDLDEDQRAEKLLEESRKRRQAILQKYSATASPTSSPGHLSPAPGSAARQGPETALGNAGPSTGSTSDFALSKEGNQRAAAAVAAANAASATVEVSAADYDPDMDKVHGPAKHKEQAENGGVAIAAGAEGTAVPSTVAGIAAGLGEPLKKAEEEEYEEIEVDDDDDVDDMFSLEEDKPKKKKILRIAKGASASLAPQVQGESGGTGAATLNDNWDDPDGYYRIILGETLDKGRYQVFANLGKGMFSSVVKARDLQDHDREVAIKIVRIQETMYKAGLKEIGILKKLADMDPEDKKHIVRLEGHFEHRGHLCMVFESLSMNLREVVKRFGKDVGLNLMAVKAYAYQMFAALSLMRKANLMHADIKPDNILVDDSKSHLKVCDLGSASDVSEMEITPYLVSRFYRAPEIILGQAYDCAIDVWSIGCTLYELATGKILFPGRSNNQMLLLMQELKGRFTSKQIRRGQFGEQHFDDTNAFLSAERDKNTGQSVIRRVVLQKPTQDLRARLLPGDAAKRLKETELRLNNNFIDLLSRCLELDPAKRITPKEALAHPFLASS